jgi:hypothetical protein
MVTIRPVPRGFLSGAQAKLGQTIAMRPVWLAGVRREILAHAPGGGWRPGQPKMAIEALDGAEGVAA